MLRINSEPGFFTEIFTELKSCGIAPISSLSSHSLATAQMMNQINNNNQQQHHHHHSHHYLVQSPTGIQSPTGQLGHMSMSQSMTSTSSSHNMGSLIAAANKMNLNNNNNNSILQQNPSMITSTSSTSSGGSDSSSSQTSLNHHHHARHLHHSNKVSSGVLAWRTQIGNLRRDSGSRLLSRGGAEGAVNVCEFTSVI